MFIYSHLTNVYGAFIRDTRVNVRAKATCQCRQTDCALGNKQKYLVMLHVMQNIETGQSNRMTRQLLWAA